MNSSEPDDVIPTDVQLKQSGSSSSVPMPGHKPPVPESGADANSMGRLLSSTADKFQGSLNASDLNVDHPYGDGGHMEPGSDTLKRLGADKKYGGQ
jgi:hypothetical protein